jgi:competence protein ComEC
MIPRGASPLMRVNMFAVGDGSCFMVRLHDRDQDEDYTILFDCGSQQYWDVGIKSIAPALERLGVDRIDLLIVSHADIDHYGGVLDVIDRVKVIRAIISPQLAGEAQARPHAAVAYLISGMRDRGVMVQVASRGWSHTVAGAALDMLWPPHDFHPRRANDTSLVLSIRQGGIRVLLNGDIQFGAIARLLESNIDLRADIADLPHHGSFVDNAPSWLERVRPRIAMQSSGAARLRDDPWPVHLQAIGTRRWITEYRGMVQIDIDAAGAMDVRTFADGDGFR